MAQSPPTQSYARTELEPLPPLQPLKDPDRFGIADGAGEHISEAKSLLQPDTTSIDVEKRLSVYEQQYLSAPGDGAEYNVSTKKKLLLLGAYFALNLSLTIYNKAVLGVFAFPWIMTFVHSTCLLVGCSILYMTGVFTTSHLSLQENLTLLAFSVLFTANIAVSNISLALVSVPFHQILRATCPAITCLLYRVLYSRTYAFRTYISLLPIIAGASLATFGDVHFTGVGFLITLLGVFLAASKAIATNRLMVGRLKLPALELLFRMSPLAAGQCLICSLVAGEWTSVKAARSDGLLGVGVLAAVLGNGILAFMLNVSSFKTNKAAGALTMAIAANTKQVLTILLGVVFFNVTVTPINGLGMGIALCGVAWYTKEELDSKAAA